MASIWPCSQDVVEEGHPAHGVLNNTSDTSESLSVQRAEAEFTHLQRQLSTHSQPLAGTDGDFDLESALRGELDPSNNPKHLAVLWDGLTVKGFGGTDNLVQTFPDAFINLFRYLRPLWSLLSCAPTRNHTEITILDDFRGLTSPGEMVLVLGRPGSGCSTFLKTITNQRFGYTCVSGDVMYGSFTAKQFERYRGEAVYNHEDDVHLPTLTVEQTLGFALDVKTPKEPPGGAMQFKRNVLNTLLRMFNIEHTRHTIVGDAMIRGVSGGERKRVSIAEMMITNACVTLWDNSTKGLDASTALDFAKSLRVYTDLYKTVTFVSLYQASEHIYNQFDKVLVIDAGRQVYFGPTTEARRYFESLGFAPKPRQTTPDYVIGCTDRFEREYQAGYSSENAPHSPGTLAEAFERSKYSEQLSAEMAQYRARLATESTGSFQAAIRETKRRAPSGSPCSVGLHLQIWALMQRQCALKLQDRLALLLSWARNLAIATLLGTLYFNLSRDSSSAFSKGGLMFMSLLFNMFEAFSELGSTMMGQRLMDKHKAYAFYQPAALWIAQIFVDAAFSAVRILIFSIMVYFMANLSRDNGAGAFWIYFFTVLITNIAITLFFRIVGCFSSDVDRAFKFVVIILTFFIVTSGYMIKYDNQQVWMRWIFYINILGLGFGSLMANEFRDSNITCSAGSMVPFGDSYRNLSSEHQACTLPGSVAGSPIISGASYIQAAFSYQPSDLWRNIGIIIGLSLFLLTMNVVIGGLVNGGMAGTTFLSFKKPNKERIQLNQPLLEKRAQRQQSIPTKADATYEPSVTSQGVSLTWEDLNYDVPISGGNCRLLNNIFGCVRPGQLTALMGASGAGKTTLLDVLAARKNIGSISGDVFVNGVRRGRDSQRLTAYAEQLDVHEPLQTVREALRFSADLRQPFEVPQSEKYTYVENVISLLEMEDIADAIIGSPEAGGGVSAEQRKRVTIGVELAAKPQLLFLDEPTSGLDSQSAFNIVRFLRKLASEGQAILCTIHQPNAALFENFDRLLLLQRGGRCVYFGDIGKDAVVLREYLSRNGATANDSDNVAEFMLDAIGAGSVPRIGKRDWADVFDESTELRNLKDTILQLKKSSHDLASNQHRGKKSVTPISHQLKIVVKRMVLSFWRSPNYLFTRISNHVAIAIVAGLGFLQLDDSQSALQEKVFTIFQLTVLPMIVTGHVEGMYHAKRTIFFHEQFTSSYSPIAFTTAMVVAEFPYSVLCAICFFFPLYYLPGFRADQAGYQFLMVLITELFSVSLGQLLAATTPSAFISSQFDPFLVMMFVLFCGVTIPATEMPAFWRSWMYQLDPFTRLIGGMLTTELHDQSVVCAPSEYHHFTAPQGQTCGEYMSAFFSSGGNGYIKDNLTSVCEYCAYSIGDQFYEPFGFSFGYRWRDMGIFLAFVGSNLIIVFLYGFLKFNRR